MKSLAFVLGSMLFVVAVSQAATAADDQQKPADALPEQSVVAYDSHTHGAIQVKCISDEPGDWFDVQQNGKSVIKGAPKLLNGTVELPPGTYVVEVNRTQRKVTIDTGKKTILLTGELIVEGQPDTAYWYPMQGKERRLASNPPLLNAARSMLPGTYTVFVHVSVTRPDANLGNANVKAGGRTVLKH